jgi:DNA-binding MarR family transcriptional regulator
MGALDDDTHHSIGRRFSILHRWMRQYFAEELGDLGIGPGQFPLMMALFHHDGITQEELTGIVHVDKATTARGVKKLEDLGFLTREVDPDDHRAYRLHLTKKSEDLMPRMKKTLHGATDMITDGLTESEKVTLIELLDKMVANAPEKGCKGCKNGALEAHHSSNARTAKQSGTSQADKSFEKGEECTQ